MRRLSFAILVAGAMLVGCGGNGTGPYQRTLDLAAIAGVYGGSYTQTYSGGSSTGSADFTFNPDGTVHGAFSLARSQDTVAVDGTVASSGAFTGHTTFGEQIDDVTGTVAPKGANGLLMRIVTLDGTTVEFDLARVQVG